jgi:3-oxoacyl-[acyl-carrier protein] reductase
MGNVIVTGGSRGIGLGIVRRLAKSGYRVTALARKESPELREAIDEVATGGTVSVGFSAYDLADTDGMPRASQATPERPRADLRAGEQRGHER